MNQKSKKASKVVTLVLVSSVLASCMKKVEDAPAVTNNAQKVYMRADSTAPYTDVTHNYAQQNHHGSSMGSSLLWFMAFRSLTGGMGYASPGLHQQSNVGTNTAKANALKGQTVRGGFGKSSSSRTVSS
ncbi:MAG TPA: hypothetical protein VIG94_03200 [Faecalibacter sp.]|uniref:hypothetical protein n=1 Tax=Faecalibacter sp. LW9 TaxID=3103144 RepID=UPI002B000CCB|nr:hypothetical protein [Faecalibacter sp. LW9]